MSVGRPRMDRQLPHCREEQLSCHECVGHAAASLASIASEINGPAIRQLFFAMYPAEPCLPMASAFVQAYQQQRKPCGREAAVLPLAHAAVA
jgi:hypothetical protein